MTIMVMISLKTF